MTAKQRNALAVEAQSELEATISSCPPKSNCCETELSHYKPPAGHSLTAPPAKSTGGPGAEAVL